MATQASTKDEAADRGSATARAYDEIKADILMCRHEPGAALYEGELAAALGMSKTPAREALGMLAQEGLVTATPRQGYRVAEITLADVQEIFQMRLLLEPAAAELAAERASPEHMQQLRELAEVQVGADYEAEVLRLGKFHSVLANASGNARLASTMGKLLDGSQRLFFIGLDLAQSVDSHHQGHRELVDAIIKGNHHLAGESAGEHVELSRLQVIEAILGSLSGSSSSSASEHVKVFPSDLGS